MKIIDIPADVTVEFSPEQKKAITFKEYLITHLDSYVEIKTVSQVRQAAKIVDTIEKADKTISLEDADFEVLKGATSKMVFIPRVSRQLLTYLDALDKVQTA